MDENMYLTYDEYEEMGGTLDETAFDNVKYQAQSFIDWITFNRLKNETDIPVEVKRCMYDLINLLVVKQTTISMTDSTDGNASVARMSNDGVSVAYNTMSATDLYDKLSSDANRIVFRHLSGVKNSEGKIITYRGLYEDE